MPEIKYVTMSLKPYSSKEYLSERLPELQKNLTDLVRETGRELQANDGFIKLAYLKNGTQDSSAYYYNNYVCGIFGGFSEDDNNLKVVNQYNVIKNLNLLEEENERHMYEVNHLQAGILTKSEYEKVFTRSGFEGVRKHFGWMELSKIVIAVIEPGDLRNNKNPMGRDDQVCVIPIHRCTESMGLYIGAKPVDIVFQLLRAGFIPVTNAELLQRYIMENAWVFQNTDCFVLDDKGRISIAQNTLPLDAEVKVITPDESKLKEIKQYYRELDSQIARVPVYDDTVFQLDNGHWKLHRFAKLHNENHLNTNESCWFDVTGQKLFSRNPVNDVVNDTEMVAIDFGTVSTTVSAIDISGSITFLPVGDTGVKDNELKHENPTILEYRNLENFEAAYRLTACSPYTKFDDISVSHLAKNDFENMERKDLLQFLRHLKQWANDPNRKLKIMDSAGNVIDFENHEQIEEEKCLDPIEIYAYYIGLSVNSMHRRKIYMKYLLSYPSAYSQDVCERIRQSFARGIKKSLPPEVFFDSRIMERFEVRLWRDEASSYAVCALHKYMEEIYHNNKQAIIEELLEELQNSGIFCGIYDFGGGTLDFNFGVLRSQGEDMPYVYKSLEGGGDPLLGCENILEELAFSIFNANRKRLPDEIKCQKPPQCEKLNDASFVSESNEARLNLNAVITKLREFWMDEKKVIGSGVNATLFTVSGTRTVKICKKKDENTDKKAIPPASSEKDPVILEIEESYIEEFFQRKIKSGVQGFFNTLKETVSENDILTEKKCSIFLAGNASKSPRVIKIFEEYLADQANSLDAGKFPLHKALPFDRDKHLQEQENRGGIPTAKTAVAYGLLLSRPGSDAYVIEEQQKKNHFLFHIGYPKRDFRYLNGAFALSVKAREMPRSDQAFRKLLRITQSKFELLYTSSPAYALSAGGSVPRGYGVLTASITVHDSHLGKFLYCRAYLNANAVIELGVSAVDAAFQEHVTIIGSYDFQAKHMNCIPEEKAAPETALALDFNCQIRVTDGEWFPLDALLGDNQTPKLIGSAYAGELEIQYADHYSNERHPDAQSGITTALIHMGKTDGKKNIYCRALSVSELMLGIMLVLPDNEQKLIMSALCDFSTNPAGIVVTKV